MINLEKDVMNWVIKLFSGSLIHSLSLHSKQIFLKIILIKFFQIFCLKFGKYRQKLQENCRNVTKNEGEPHDLYLICPCKVSLFTLNKSKE